MLYENLKTTMWHFDDSWIHGVIYQICFWGDELEIVQHITSGKVEIFVFGMPYVCWEQQNWPKLIKILITILLGAYLSLRLVVPPTY